MRTVKIRMDVAGTSITATLDDNDTARDFASLLPLTLTLRDYAATEKISDLPRRLSTKDAPAGTEPSAGDVAYYALWGNLALFYQDFEYSGGLVRLGTLDAGIEVLRRPGPLELTIERYEARTTSRNEARRATGWPTSAMKGTGPTRTVRT
jgi:hypothetical protein